MASYRAELVLEVECRDKDILRVIRLFSDLHIPILQLAMLEETTQYKRLSLEVSFDSPSKIALFFYHLKKQQNSIKLLRKKFV